MKQINKLKESIMKNQIVKVGIILGAVWGISSMFFIRVFTDTPIPYRYSFSTDMILESLMVLPIITFFVPEYSGPLSVIAALFSALIYLILLVFVVNKLDCLILQKFKKEIRLRNRVFLGSILLVSIVLIIGILGSMIFNILEPTYNAPFYMVLLSLIVLSLPCLTGMFIGGVIGYAYCKSNLVVKILLFVVLFSIIAQGLYTYSDYKRCKDEDGRWHGVKKGCELPAEDAGIKCNTSSQCQYVCLAHNKTSMEGYCSRYKPYLGCWCYYEKGSVKCICRD